MKKILLIGIYFCITTNLAQADVMKDFDGLGENKDLFDTAKALHPELNVKVVQDRVVKRRNRLEISPEISMFAGGDAYIDTYSYGATLNYHIVPWISLGARYSKFSNPLTKEGENLITDKDANGQGIIPEIDYPKTSTMGFVNIYPIYGKLNMMNLGITHFDVYFTGGYGSISLMNGSKPTWTAGGGIAFWFSQHFTTRFEVRYQTYEASLKKYNQTVNYDNTVFGFQFGYLL